MQSPFYLFCFLLVILVVRSAKVDEAQQKGDAPVESKKNNDSNGRKNLVNKKKSKDNDDDIDDDFGELSSYADQRYSPFEFAAPTQRSRQRWQNVPPTISIIDDDENTYENNDWSRWSFENGLSLSSPYEMSQPSNNRPTCSSLIDPKYPVFADVCGAVPQARYALPNSLGHRERWQVAQFLQGILSGSSDPTCIRSLRLLLCPILFPPCPSRHASPPVLPCQSYCRAVKSRCAIPALEFLPCESLPYTSEICPVNQGFNPVLSQPSLPPNFQWPNSNPFPNVQQYPYLQSGLAGQGLPQSMFGAGQFNTDNTATISPVEYTLRSLLNDQRQAGSRQGVQRSNDIRSQNGQSRSASGSI